MNPQLSDLVDLAERCVRCGLCLPACPTYGVARDEAQSPRGRIALIQGWATGRLDLSRRLEDHLDGCLGCRACETACPTGVPYGRLADAARAARLARRAPWRRGLRRAWLAALSDARASRGLAWAARLYRGLGLGRLAERIGLAHAAPLAPYHRLSAALAEAGRPLGASAPARAGPPDPILFAGCAGELAQGRAIAAALSVLAQLGLHPAVPERAQCCGALLRHQGFPREADARRRDALHRSAPVPLVALASACLAELREGADPAAAPIDELCDYLDRSPNLDRLPLRPLAWRVAVHAPCSHRRLPGGNAAVYRLLRRIPGIEVVPLGGSDCCGAAGIHMLEHPCTAQALLRKTLGPVARLAPDVLATTNPGCALHLAAGLAESGSSIRVCHPVEVFFESCK